MTAGWNIKKFTKSNLTEYFYYFFIVAAVIVILLSGTLYYIYTTVMENEIIRSDNTILEQIKNAHETLIADVESSIANIAMDNTISGFEDVFDSGDTLMIREVFERLNSYTMRDSYINSISVYFLDSRRVLQSEMGFCAVDNYYDKEFLNNLGSSGGIKKKVIIRNMPQGNGNPSLKVMTFIVTIPLNSTDVQNAAIIVNVDAKYFQDTLDYIDVRDGSNIIITDQDGTIFTVKKENAAPCINSSQFLKFNNEKQNYSEVKKVDGKKYLVSYVMSSKYGLRYIYLVPLSIVTAKLQFLGRITLFICLGILCLSLWVSLVLSKRIYSPIRGIISILSENAGVNNRNDEQQIKETKVIEKSINSLVNSNKDLTRKNKDLETVLAEYNLYQRNRFLQEIMYGEWDMDLSVLQKLDYYKIEINPEGYVLIILLSIDNYNEYIMEYSEKQKNMLDIYINENIDALILKDCKGFISELRNNEKAIVLNLDADLTVEEVNLKTTAYIRQITELANVNSKFSFTLGVSRIYKGLDNLNKCYNESYYALNYRLILGYSQIIRYEDIKVHNDYTVLYPFHIEKDMLNNLKMGNKKGIIDSLQDFNSYFYHNPVENIETVRHYFQQLLSSSLKSMYEIDRGFYSSIFSDENIYTEMASKETIQGMSAYINKLFDSMLQYISSQKNEKNKEFLNSLINYIKENLHSDLSVERIAELFSISASYLRKIFKAEIGEPIKEFIDKERMKEAKRLLENPKIKIGEIAGKIGYISVSSFTRAFKQETGKTPGEYREEFLHKQ
ncbi:MAG: AraC family transcriptional regulator [Bacillota bacterium]|nr:AraC family transcriptional regulator [Bacillota bacterium]